MNKKLIYAIVGIFILLVLALLVFDREEEMYGKPVQAVFSDGQADSLQLKPAQLKNLISTGNFFLVDIRKPEFFITESIEGAVNIPAGELLTEENEEKLEEAMDAGKKIVVFGATTEETLLPWLLLRQKGIDNAFLLLGGIEGWKKYQADSAFTPSPLETSALDYSAAIEKLKADAGVKSQEENVSQKPKVTPKPVVHSGAAEGGC